MHFPPPQSFVQSQNAPLQLHVEAEHALSVVHCWPGWQPVFTQPAGFGPEQPAGEHVLP